jgi:hypothetical protein
LEHNIIKLGRRLEFMEGKSVSGLRFAIPNVERQDRKSHSLTCCCSCRLPAGFSRSEALGGILGELIEGLDQLGGDCSRR